MKTLPFKKPSVNTHNQQRVLALQKELSMAREDLRLAYVRFDQVVDEDLIEACIFQMNAAMAQCNYLVRTIKSYTPAAPSQSDALAATQLEEHSTWT